MIDITIEQPIRLHEAAALAGKGRGGKPHAFSTILRWLLDGVKGPNGETIRLEGIRMGGHWCTSREALQRFGERLTPNLGAAPAPVPRSPGKRQRASEQASRQLDRIGI